MLFLRGRARLDQIPSMAENVAEHGDGAVGLVAGVFFECHAPSQKSGMVAGKFVGL